MKESFYIPIADDMHCHLRQDDMLKFTVNAVKEGGCNRVLVMPNTIPIISNCEDAKNYKNELMKYDNSIDYLMTLYLNKLIDENDILDNYKECNFQGIKIYPSNVTTNSNEGVTNLEPYYKIFDVLQKLNKSLHIHCEEPNINPLYAERNYLDRINDLAVHFPHLKIVLEHISTTNSINLIKKFPNLAGSITPQHLYLTIDDVFNMDEYDFSIDNITIEKYIKNVYHYCKPIAKTVDDKISLRNLIKKDFPRVFLGSDSAPHYKNFKNKPHFKPGIYTQPFLLSYVSHILNKFDCLDKLQNFTSKNAEAFFNLEEKKLNEGELSVYIENKKFEIPEQYFGVVPFLANQTIDFTASCRCYNS